MTQKQQQNRQWNMEYLQDQINYYTMLLRDFKELCTEYEPKYLKELNEQMAQFEINPSLIYL